MGDFEIIKKTTGEASDYAPLVVELYQKRNGKTEPIENALNRLKKDSALLKGNNNSHKILLCFETDPYPSDYECITITRGAIKILDKNTLEYVIFTENTMRAVSDFQHLKHPKNITLIIKIESIQHNKNSENQIDEEFVNLLRKPIRKEYKKGVRTGIHFGPKSDPALSLQVIYKLHSVVNFWKVDKHLPYETPTKVRSNLKEFNEDAKAKGLFKNLAPLQTLNDYNIKRIPGDPRLLLIAPHGVATFPKDDINTDKLTLKIAEKLKCSAIVNDVISRLYLDLNKIIEASKHKQFISAIENAVKTDGPTLVVWIHGIGKDNLETEIQKLGVKKDIQCFIGYGQPGKLSANRKTVDDLIKLLKVNSILAHVARVGSNYCGHSDLLMNQWFRLNKYELKDVESVQLEFKEKGIRRDNDLDKAAQNIANALSELLNLKIHGGQTTDETKNLLPIKEVIGETKSDTALVDKAYAKISDIFYSHAGDAAFEVGEFIVREFFNNEIELVKSQSPVKELSLNQLINKIQSSYHKQPSRSWVLQAVKLYVETRELETTVQTYGQLLISHKILLFPIRNRDTKIQLIQETVQNRYTVVDLKNRIAELMTAEKPKIEAPKSLLQVVTNPDLLFSDNYASACNVKSLSKLKPAELEKIHKKANAKLLDIEHDVEEIELKLTTQREYARNYKKLLKSIEHAKINGKESNKKRVKSEFKGSEKAKTITDDGVEKGAVAPVIISESRVKRGGRNRRYELTSAFQKSIRWCEINDSRYFARQLMEMGFPGTVFNRLIVISAEDVGLADPSLIVYERECSDSFENLIKQNKMKKRDAVKFPALCNIVDRAVIAAAIAYKSRLLPQLSFATLFDVYQNEDFIKNLPEYLDRFVEALGMKDEKQALYYAYVAGIFLNSMDKILALIQRQNGLRNGNLTHQWVDEYKRKGELLMLAGSVALLCRDLNYKHGEYEAAVSQYLPLQIMPATIPDRAYDRHTIAGKRRGRGLEHFFDEAATVKNERFPNNWQQAGRNSYISAEKKGLEKAAKVIEAIKEKHEKYKKS